MKIAVIVGTRPEIIKMAKIITILDEENELLLIHTGQHYSHSLDKVFFEELKLPIPDIQLQPLETSSQGSQTCHILTRIEQVLIAHQPSAVLVQGDTNSVLAGALAASKLFIPIGHVEAGLRSHQLIPEEINRKLTDHMSSWLFAPTELSKTNLLKEGIDVQKIIVTGNTIADSIAHFHEISSNSILRKYELIPKEFVLITLHRQENVDSSSVP